ncbi:hypothetical protein CEXT_217331 [Caerostris extrusa]|uniref:Uncharacterized protein n=1 Tax=Caerostris extrusa TaxID=172846 RepID=A0AAV4SN17_CAEEX|nr:hypothetical protein CEXT_217331 [Caerostris extrusa]
MESITKDKITSPRRPSDDGYPMEFLIDMQNKEHKGDKSPPHIDYLRKQKSQMKMQETQTIELHKRQDQVTIPRRPSDDGYPMGFLIDMQNKEHKGDKSLPYIDYIREAKVPDENARNPDDVKSISAHKTFQVPQLSQSPFENPSVDYLKLWRTSQKTRSHHQEGQVKYPMEFLIDMQNKEHKGDKKPPTHRLLKGSKSPR